MSIQGYSTQNSARRKTTMNVSPMRMARPSTALVPDLNKSLSARRKTVMPHHSEVATLNVVEEVNNMEIGNQDKDIEIERLKTTCEQLNNRVAINDDLMH